ncbi:MAG: bifunctional aspartate kinase/homoserine dehydrogenase I [Flavobacteriales bacterium]|jgi:homoserine O-acetyltransferase|nr:bifunctional aspartate kinase/homoserine dehydrogenase I [Flavobacteriales bacterium]
MDKKIYQLPATFTLESGKEIDKLEIAYQTFGKLNKDKDNVLWVFHAISGDTNVLSWWKELFGDSKIFNPKEYYIICANTLGSPFGSSAPENFEFPNFSVRDISRAFLSLAKELNIQKIQTLIGGSFGGNQALEFAYSFSGSIKEMILLASSARESAWGIALHESQRLALLSDQTFGQKNGGSTGLKAARSMALLNYRNSQKIDHLQTDQTDKLSNYKAISYLHHQADKFVRIFPAISYYYLTKCLDTHAIGRNRGSDEQALTEINIPTLIIGISSDQLNPPKHQKFLAKHLPQGTYKEIESDYGHDGFLTEGKKISQAIVDFRAKQKRDSHLGGKTLIKFGGSSLSNENLEKVLDIIYTYDLKKMALVVSARGKSTDMLEELYTLASNGKIYFDKFEKFIKYQYDIGYSINLESTIDDLREKLLAISKLRIQNEVLYADILAFGEILSAKTLSQILQQKGVSARFVDARKCIHLFGNKDDERVDFAKSKIQTIEEFENLETDDLPIITGFIASDNQGKTSILQRNGSNYTASLIASFIQAKEIVNYTDVDGIYSTHPAYYDKAVLIENLSYKQANEMANFGLNILHSKTLHPLMDSHIPLRIKNTMNPSAPGTLITKSGGGRACKALTIIENVCLVSIEGNGLLGEIGIDARIFSALSQANISIRLISQASSERGIGFIIDQKQGKNALSILKKEFEQELNMESISAIKIQNNVSILSIIGRHNYALEKAIGVLRRNQIWIHLINNSIQGEHISLVIDSKSIKKAVAVVHQIVFGARKRLHVFAIGKGNVGGSFVNQVLQTSEKIAQERNLDIKIIGVADSKKYIFNPEGVSSSWRKDLTMSEKVFYPDIIHEIVNHSGIINLVVVDNTASLELTNYYPSFIQSGFDIVSSNKQANTRSLAYYKALHRVIRKKEKNYYYETNVGAGLPIIGTLKSLYHSSDNIRKIRGVFSGSLSYIFNEFSTETKFSDIVEKAGEKGFTEPDPRDDLGGKDVERKLLILAREIGLQIEASDIKTQNLIPENLRNIENQEDFKAKYKALDEYYEKVQKEVAEDEVLRFIGEIDVEIGKYEVKLEKVKKQSPLGKLEQSNVLIEIYTESYEENPIIVQGAGAGAEVTARGVYSDLLAIGKR